ncbi:hypothetical protein [Paenibacillus sp. HW567]|uniref:hypothetical protein n=1 Tax=Paenibacillus sp. HW567 TaxID=1034769 RepID=UPI000369F054|nr:hypothetical protein [Paenibacillus sp. HW567]
MLGIQKIVWIGCLSALAVLASGCTNGADSKNTDASARPTAEAVVSSSAVLTPAIVEVTPRPSAQPVSLFAGGVPEYDGSGRAYLTGGTELQANYSADQHQPLALFMPEQMIRFEQNARTAWGTPDKQNWIVFKPVSNENTAEPKVDKTDSDGSKTALLQYKEYQGSYSENDGRVDVFLFTAKGQEYHAQIRTTAEQREKLLPLFVDMLREVQYMKKQPPLVAGVFVQKPDVGKGKENKQMLQEVMNCLEAIATQDKQKFMKTMYSPETGEYLGFYFDNRVAYRFNEITYAGIPAKGTQRADFNVAYQSMTDEGYLADRSNTISLLRNKQGEWKVANID